MKDSDSVMDLDTDSNRSASGTNDGRLTERPDKEASINEETEEVKESQTARKDNKEQPNNSVDSDEYKAATQNTKHKTQPLRYTTRGQATKTLTQKTPTPKTPTPAGDQHSRQGHRPGRKPKKGKQPRHRRA